MTYVVGAVALAIVLFLVLRRRDSRVATIKSLPTYGTTEAAGLQQRRGQQDQRDPRAQARLGGHARTDRAFERLNR